MSWEPKKKQKFYLIVEQANKEVVTREYDSASLCVDAYRKAVNYFMDSKSDVALAMRNEASATIMARTIKSGVIDPPYVTFSTASSPTVLPVSKRRSS